MTANEARGYIQGKLNCMNKCDVFEREHSENKDLCDNCEYCYSQGTFGEQKEAFQIAIKALEKQIPKKITHPGCYDNEGIWHTWNGINGVPYDLCPNCKINLCTGGVFGRDKNKMKYCKNCGQKLDWSDEE